MSRIVFGAILLFVAGCTGGPEPPKTYPANGTVVYKDGKPMTGGTIQFDTADDPLLRVIGTIGQDGKFTLSTIKDNVRLDGAPAGEYKVTVQPPTEMKKQGDAPVGHKMAPSITLPKSYRVEAKDSNSFTIQVEHR